MCFPHLLRISKLAKSRTKVVIDLKLMVGGSEHKVMPDESGFMAYCAGVDWGVNFLSVTHFVTALKECKTFLDDVVSGNFMFSREDVQRFAS